ncbi:MAG: hypothetical protein DCC44_10490 [Acidobacteria bacterium]|nr:MAG: hypothetical protein DCC44_10490 [Acidobacteriota bacterium]
MLSGHYRNIDLGNCKINVTLNRLNSTATATVSVPKFWNGNNVQNMTVADMPYVLDNVSDALEPKCPFDFEAPDARLSRLDLAHSFQLESESTARAYRDHVATQPTWGHYTPHLIGKDRRKGLERDYGKSQAVMLRQRQQEICCYLKYSECVAHKDPAATIAKGVLRIEHRYLNSAKVTEFLEACGYRNRAGDVWNNLLELTDEQLDLDMERLGLKQTLTITSDREQLAAVATVYADNPTRGALAYGYLSAYRMHGTDAGTVLGLSRRYEKDLQKELRERGINLASVAKVLPPLSLRPCK